MVVCVCNAIREKDVRAAARGGAMSPCAAYAALGRRPRCGQCVPFAREIIAQERAAA
jgi:bacterioferritin-associated ferredoxin